MPDTTSKINFKDNNSAFDAAGVQFVINPYDEFGLTRAIQIKEQLGGHVTAVHVGDASTEPTLRKALAIGADDAIRVDAVPVDAFQVASELASVAKEGGYDLIIAGRESIDYNGGQVPGMLAEMLGLPFINACVGLELNGSSATLSREIDGGKEQLTAQLPLVLAGQKGLVEEKDLRIPNMRGIMTARTKPLAVKSPSAGAAMTKVAGYDKPAPKAAVKLIPADQVEELVNLLHNEAKVI